MKEKGKIFWLPTIMKLLTVPLTLWLIISGIKVQIEGLYKFDGSTVEAWLLAIELFMVFVMIYWLFKNFKDLVTPLRHEVPRFKPGDIIQDKKYNTVKYIIKDIKRNEYILGNSNYTIDIDYDQDKYEKIGTTDDVIKEHYDIK